MAIRFLHTGGASRYRRPSVITVALSPMWARHTKDSHAYSPRIGIADVQQRRGHRTQAVSIPPVRDVLYRIITCGFGLLQW